VLFHRKIVRLAVPVLAGSMLLAGCGGGDDSANGDTVKIAFQGPLSGDNVQLGVNMANGIKLAIKQANAKGDLGFKVEYKAVDDQGLPEKATAAAQKAIDDQSVLAVVGPAFSGATDSASPLYSEAGLVTVSPSATRPDLTTKGYKSLLRAVPNDSSQGKGMAAFFDKKTDVKKVMVVDDKTDYGVGLADVAVKELKAVGIKVQRTSAQQKTPDYSATAQKIVNSGADGLIYAGYYQDAGPFAKKVKEAGFKGVMMSDDGVKDAQFVKLAGDASEGWYMTCPCTDPTANAKTKEFATDYKKEFNQAPGTYSAESYDVTNMIIEQLKKLGKDTSREKLRDALAKATYEGLTKTFSFDESGNLKKQAIFLYQVKNGKIEYLGGVDELTAG
jgi:branched-chain amino acid transport system substrate-binding protein